MTFINKSLLGGIGGLLQALGSLLSGVIVARLLGPEGTGIVTSAIWLTFVASSVAGLGLKTSLVRFLPELIAREEGGRANGVMRGFRQLTLLSTLATALVLAALWLFLWRPVAGSTWVLLILCFAVTNVGEYQFAQLRASQRFDRLAIVLPSCAAIRVLAVLVLAYLLGTNGALIAYILSYMLPLLMFFSSSPKKEAFPSDLVHETIRYSGYAWMVLIINALVWTRLEIVFVGLYLGVNAVGLFAAGLGLANLTSLLPALLSTALLPHLSQQRAKGGQAEFLFVYRGMVLALALLIVPICFGTAAISPILLPLLFGEDFVPAVSSAIVLIAFSGLGVLALSARNLLFSLDRGLLLLNTNLFGLALLLTAGLLIVPEFGLLGAAWSRGIVHLVIIAVQLTYLQYHGFAFPMDPLVRITVAASLCAASAYAVVDAVGGVMGLALAISAGVFVYLLALRLLKVITAIDPAILDRAVISSRPRFRHFILLSFAFLGHKRSSAGY